MALEVMTWVLRRGLAGYSGNFLVSGRKVPRDGGIILAVGESRERIEEIIREDPFHSHGLATFRIIEFRASQNAPDFPKRDA
jgi:uncharacterized protein YciI